MKKYPFCCTILTCINGMEYQCLLYFCWDDLHPIPMWCLCFILPCKLFSFENSSNYFDKNTVSSFFVWDSSFFQWNIWNMCSVCDVICHRVRIIKPQMPCSDLSDSGMSCLSNTICNSSYSSYFLCINALKWADRSLHVLIQLGLSTDWTSAIVSIITFVWLRYIRTCNIRGLCTRHLF